MEMLQAGFLTAVKKLNGIPDADQKVIAGELLNLYLSIQLMARVNPNQHILDKQVRQSLDNLLANPRQNEARPT